jgi:drug/metabolite transporter (DMT)-like permease
MDPVGEFTAIAMTTPLFVTLMASRALGEKVPWHPTTLMPCLYAQIPFAILGGWIFNAHLPDRYTLLGMVLIALSGLGSGLLALDEDKAKSVKQ